MKIRPPWMRLPGPFSFRLAFPGDAKREGAGRRAARKAARKAGRGASRREAPVPVPVSGPLRAFRAAALWGLAVLVAVADGAAFTESYRGLFEWAEHHGLAGFWAAAFPAQVDTFIVAGEVVLFIAMTDRWSRRDRAGAWAVALLGLAVSVAGNIGHVAAHDLQSRGTAAVPPVAAFGALWLGLGVLKRVLRQRGEEAAETARNTHETAERDTLAQALDGLAGAVRSIAARDDGTVSPASARADETALPGDLPEAVREAGARTGGMVSVPVPSDAEHAALIALRATAAAGNPLSLNQLCQRFGLTRAQATRTRNLALGDDGDRREEAAAKALLGLPAGPVPRLRRIGEPGGYQDAAGLNGHHPDTDS